jgi:hypothetical protein
MTAIRFDTLRRQEIGDPGCGKYLLTHDVGVPLGGQRNALPLLKPPPAPLQRFSQDMGEDEHRIVADQTFQHLPNPGRHGDGVRDAAFDDHRYLVGSEIDLRPPQFDGVFAPEAGRQHQFGRPHEMRRAHGL